MPHRHACLERLEGADRHVVSRHPLDPGRERQFIGRMPDSVVKLQHSAIAQKHVMLEFGPLGRWWLDELGTPAGVWINFTHYRGRRRVLEPKDIIRFEGSGGDDLVFRFAVEGWTQQDALLRTAIDEAPSDDARWQVWADFLEEQGDPLAARIRGLGPSPGDLGVGSGHGWEHGFIAHGILQRGGRLLAAMQPEFEALLGNPFSRWMCSLHIDLASYRDATSREDLQAVSAMTALAGNPPVSLLALSFKFSRRPRGDRLRDAFSTLKQALPRLQSGFEALVQR